MIPWCEVWDVLKADMVAGAQVCADMDKFSLFEYFYFNISSTVGKIGWKILYITYVISAADANNFVD